MEQAFRGKWEDFRKASEISTKKRILFTLEIFAKFVKFCSR
jgi:hypothetical protein